jgi:phospholipase C
MSLCIREQLSAIFKSTFNGRLIVLVIALLSFPALPATAASCPLSTTNPSVTICSPTNGSTVTSPVMVDAGSTDSKTVSYMQIYLDGTKVYQVSGGSLHTSLTIAAGTHRLTVQAKDSAGQIFKSTVNITVGTGGGTGPCALNSTDPSVTICTPNDGTTVTSPVHVVAGTTDSSQVTAMKIYLDGTAVYSTVANQLDTNVAMANGGHRVAVQAWDKAGRVFKSVVNITVGTPPPPPDGLSNLNHIIFLLQENRSQDNYFGRMGQYRRDRGFNDPYDELPLNVSLIDRAGHPVQPYHFQTVCHENLSPGWNESHYDVDGGKMDKFMQTAGSVPSTIDPDGTRAMGYYDWNDLPYYYELAFQFASSDKFFSSVLAPTIPNRMYMFAGTSFGHIRPDAAPSGGWTQKTIFDALDAAGVSWRYYYQDNSVYLAEWQTWAKDSGKVYNISSYYNDIKNPSTLPSVIFIERAASTGLDEHPSENVQKGAARVKQILDALMQSPTWDSSAFILTYDEGGGLYDHVVPPSVAKPDDIAPMLRSTDRAGDFTQMGFRVPLMVISPWSKPHYVSHNPMELTSILRLIEKRFNVPALTARDANAPDMTEFFDFTQPALLTPPPLPDQPTTGLCSFSAEKAPGH